MNRKKTSKTTIIICFLLTLIYVIISNYKILNLDNVWNYSYGYLSVQNKIPYLEFNTCVMPFQIYSMTIFYKLFGLNMLWVGPLILFILTTIFSFYIIDKTSITNTLVYKTLFLIINSNNASNEYNYLIFTLILFLLFVLIKTNNKKILLYLSPIVFISCIYIKLSLGIMLCFFLFPIMLWWIKKTTYILYSLSIFIGITGFILFCFYINNSLSSFIDQCIWGNLSHSSGSLERILFLLITVIVFGICLIFYIKETTDKTIYDLCIIGLIIVFTINIYPTFNYYHFCFVFLFIILLLCRLNIKQLLTCKLLIIAATYFFATSLIYIKEQKNMLKELEPIKIYNGNYYLTENSKKLDYINEYIQENTRKNKTYTYLSSYNMYIDLMLNNQYTIYIDNIIDGNLGSISVEDFNKFINTDYIILDVDEQNNYYNCIDNRIINYYKSKKPYKNIYYNGQCIAIIYKK